MAKLSRLPFPAFWITLALFLAAEVAIRLLPTEYGAQAGIFMTNYRRKVAESSTPAFDYLIMGDSRSLSLNGHAPSASEPYSVYNFSMPALGSRYFQFLLTKYLKKRKDRPAALIFAGDPQHFQAAYRAPIQDQAMIYADSYRMSVASYLWARVHKRIRYALSGGEPRNRLSKRNETLLWNAFSHRYLQLFGFGELAAQYTGAERLYLLRESLPNLAHLYRFREAIEHHTLGFRPSMLRAVKIPAFCNSCAGTMRPECYPRSGRIQDRKRLAAIIRENYGGVNIGDRIRPQDRIFAYAVRDKMIAARVEHFKHIEPDLTELENLIKAVGALGIKLIITELPDIDAFRGNRFARLYRPRVRALAARYPHVKVIPFGNLWYPRELFVEQVHYDCLGAVRLNRDFYRDVMPQVLKFAPPRKNRQSPRGF